MTAAAQFDNVNKACCHNSCGQQLCLCEGHPKNCRDYRLNSLDSCGCLYHRVGRRGSRQLKLLSLQFNCWWLMQGSDMELAEEFISLTHKKRAAHKKARHGHAWCLRPILQCL